MRHSTHDKLGRAIGACTRCGAGIGEAGTADSVATCPNCGARVRLVFVLGEHSATPCDGACMSAIGPICSCACGGANHGRMFLPIELIPVWEQEAARKAQAKRIADFAARQARKVAKVADREREGRERILAGHPTLAALLDREWFTANSDNGFIDDMRTALTRGDMSDRQITAAVNAVERVAQRAARAAEYAAADAALRAAGVSVQTGRRVITGEMVGVKEVEDNYSFTGRTLIKVTVKEESGARVYGTLPKSTFAPADGITSQERYAAWFNGLRGRTVTMTATVEQSDRDPAFGFFKRPVKVTVN